MTIPPDDLMRYVGWTVVGSVIVLLLITIWRGEVADRKEAKRIAEMRDKNRP